MHACSAVFKKDKRLSAVRQAPSGCLRRGEPGGAKYVCFTRLGTCSTVLLRVRALPAGAVWRRYPRRASVRAWLLLVPLGWFLCATNMGWAVLVRYSPIRLRRIPASVFLGRFCPCVFLRIFIPVFVCYMSCLSDAYRNFYLAT